jgi:aspartyl-tRNA(Asn)/glutamyl-tRNA(Gln) amidotransferase subunit B
MVEKKFEAVIGLEVHVQLQTESKIFSSSSATFGAEENTRVDPICLGLPGVLPVLNKKAVEYAIRMGLATYCTIVERSIFARKHYFYPDLPKGYQISQYEEPLCENGFLEIEQEDGAIKRINIIRIHLEEDAGKSVHNEDYVAENETLIDLNRCGVPLIEIVSGPDIRTPKQAALYLEKIRQLVRYLGISDGNMSEGSLRCDANISIRPSGSKTLGTKTELKNMNSISGVEKALAFEIKRQIEAVKGGGEVHQQTLLWDENRSMAKPMRSKEHAHDYRYFPDPDLLPLVVEAKWRKHIESDLPELPWIRRHRFIEQYQLPEYDADVLTSEREMADYFEAVAGKVKSAKSASNWVMGEVMRVLNERKRSISDFPIQPKRLAELLNFTEDGTISGNVAKRIFDEMLENDQTPAQIVKEKSLEQISDTGELEKLVGEFIQKHPEEAERYRNGEQKLMGFFVGQIMRATKGKANPQIVNELIEKKLGNIS